MSKIKTLDKICVVGFFILCDIVTGLIGALKEHNFKSSIMREGLFHKLGEIFALMFSYGCEYSFPYLGIEINIPIVTSISVYLCLMEVGSVIENLTRISPELKVILSKVFGAYRKKDEE